MMEKIVDITKGVYKETIVRCKDCKHWRSDGGALMLCEHTDIPTDACDFYSWGEADMREREGE
jgi:hypothetical protein